MARAVNPSPSSSVATVRREVWIAGAQPEAAQHGITTTTPRGNVAAVMLASDGAALDRHPTATTWRDLYDEAVQEGPDAVLQRIHDAEAADPDGQRWPRAKQHDDKTLVCVHWPIR